MSDKEDNIVKLRFKETKVKQKKQVVASVFLQEKDIGLHLPQIGSTVMLKPRAAYDLALMLLKAIKVSADKYLKKDE